MTMKVVRSLKINDMSFNPMCELVHLKKTTSRRLKQRRPWNGSFVRETCRLIALRLYCLCSLTIIDCWGLEAMDEKAEATNGSKKKLSACDVEALKKCLEENKGDYFKCQTQIEAFKSSCALKKPSQTLDTPPKA